MQRQILRRVALAALSAGAAMLAAGQSALAQGKYKESPLLAEQVKAGKLPPVEQWSPDNVDDSHMRIAADGTWYHEG